MRANKTLPSALAVAALAAAFSFNVSATEAAKPETTKSPDGSIRIVLPGVAEAKYDTSKTTFVVPPYMADNWNMFAGVKVAARIKKFEPWAWYESLSPCVIDAKFCEAVRAKLQVATVQFAKSPGYELSWIVAVPKEQNLKLGESVVIQLPSTTKEMADAVLDPTGKIQTMNCRWGQVVHGGDFEGVICDRWNYSDLRFVAAKKKGGTAP